MLFLVFNSAIRNPKSASGMANFFMDETKSQYPKPDPKDFHANIYLSRRSLKMGCVLIF